MASPSSVCLTLVANFIQEKEMKSILQENVAWGPSWTKFRCFLMVSKLLSVTNGDEQFLYLRSIHLSGVTAEGH